jgi:hypothetical protein
VIIVGAASSLRSFGLLISEAPPQSGVAGAPGSGTKLAIRYALRYLVRVDVAVRGARNASLTQLRLSGGGLVDRQGRALARVYLENPTESLFQVQVDAELLGSSGTPLGPRFPLILPIKHSRVGNVRRSARVLPGARVRLEARVPEPVPPGTYRLIVRLRRSRKQLQRVEFPVRVGRTQFPAQAVVLPRVVSSVRVSPPRIELSVGRGGARMVPLLLENLGKVTVDLDLASLPQDRGSESRIVVRPSRVTLAPQAKHRVAIMFVARGAPGPSHYELLRVRVRPHGGLLGGAQLLKIAILGTAAGAPQPRLGEPTLDQGSAGPMVFAIPVRNLGSRHVSLSGRLQVRDSYERVLEEIQAGFGAWLLPGEETRLLFRLSRPLPAGEYGLRIDLDTPGEAIAIQRTLRVPTAKGSARVSGSSLLKPATPIFDSTP